MFILTPGTFYWYLPIFVETSVLNRKVSNKMKTKLNLNLCILIQTVSCTNSKMKIKTSSLKKECFWKTIFFLNIFLNNSTFQSPYNPKNSMHFTKFGEEFLLDIRTGLFYLTPKFLVSSSEVINLI